MSSLSIHGAGSAASETGSENADLERPGRSPGPSASVSSPELQGLRRRPGAHTTTSASNVSGRRAAMDYEVNRRTRDAQRAKNEATQDAHCRNLDHHLSTNGHNPAPVTEYKGEIAAMEWMKKNHPEAEMLMGFKPGHGHDQVWVMRDEAGNPETYFLVEAKGPGNDAKLDTKAKKGEQMGIDWINNTNNEMLKSADPEKRQLGRALRDAIHKGAPEVRGLALKNIDGTEEARKVEIPANEHINSAVWRSRLDVQGPGTPERDGLATEGEIRKRSRAQETAQKKMAPTIEEQLDPEIVKQLRSRG
jgi:hypothetical protein